MNHEGLEETISAALDGERVDLRALRRALEDPGGRDLLASFVLLRAATAADPIEAAPHVSARIQAAMQRRGWRWFAGGPGTRLAMAASLATLAVAASFWFGTRWQGGYPAAGPGVPPAAVAGPARAGEPVAAAGAASGVRLETAGVEQPPPPTRVLRFEPGTDWRDGT